MAELEELIESYRAFAATATLSAPADRATQRKLLKRTHKIIGPPPDTLAETRPELAQCEDLVDRITLVSERMKGCVWAKGGRARCVEKSICKI